MTIDFQALGFTKEELQERVVTQIVESLLTGQAEDEDGYGYATASTFKKEIMDQVRSKIDEHVEKIAEERIGPKITEMIEATTLQLTNQWGEKKGEPVTFIEYLVSRAEHYMTEKVDYDGKPVSNSYGRSENQTRITHLIDKRLQYSLAVAVKEIVNGAQSTIAEGIQEAVKIKLKEVSNSLKINVQA